MVDGIFTIPLVERDAAGGGSVTIARGGFVGGPENLLARHVVEACCRQAEPHRGVVVLHGPSGCGKSHLARGLALSWRDRFRGARVTCVSGEDFVHGYLAALADDHLEKWRERICGSDLLVIDDLAPLAGKRGPQVELRQALDSLAARASLVVLTARSLPSHWRGLSASLRSRISGGLAVNLALPAPLTRRYVLELMAKARGVSLSEGAARKLATGIATSVPALAAALNELCGSPGQGSTETVDARRVQQLAARRRGRTPSLSEIARLTAKHFGLQVADLKGPQRQRSLVAGRSLAMHLARLLTNCSLDQIGAYFGGRDHTTVLHGCRRTERLLRQDGALRQAASDLKQALVAT